MSRLLERWSLSRFKAEYGISRINIFVSNDNNPYALDEEGNYLGSVDPQALEVSAEDVVVLHFCKEDDTNDHWLYFTVMEEKEPITSW